MHFEKRSKTYVKDHGLGEKHIFSSFFFTGPGTSENVFVKNVNYTNVKMGKCAKPYFSHFDSFHNDSSENRNRNSLGWNVCEKCKHVNTTASRSTAGQWLRQQALETIPAHSGNGLSATEHILGAHTTLSIYQHTLGAPWAPPSLWKSVGSAQNALNLLTQSENALSTTKPPTLSTGCIGRSRD